MPKKKTAKGTSAKKKTSSVAEPAMTKAAFVRTQPRDMPADEVIAKAKEAGLTIDAQTVYKHRPKKKGAKKSSALPKKTATGGGSRSTRRGAKKSRVLALVAKNPTWGAEQVANAAKCSTTYVYSVWREKPNGASPATTASPTNGATTEFYRAVKKVGGVSKAKELLANIEAFQNA